ncbi:MAG: FolC bifunctional protein [Hyphomicrobiales bacterium]|nr:FolC bifunctional protein [Hyphomicrobiales bacterium]
MFDLPKFGRGISLARVDALLDACGVDRARLAARSIVVTGSNGKGSTCAFLSHIAMRAGLRVGTFTSPHLLRINERFRLDWCEIGDDAMQALARDVSAEVRALEGRFCHGTFGAFEAQFVAAALWFQRRDADLCVFEAGIGGRLDATRLVRASVTVLASIDLEHTALLGSQLDLIALDKSDACAAGGTIVHGENLLPLQELLSTYVRLRDIRPLFIGRDAEVSDVQIGPLHMRFSLHTSFMDFTDLVTPLQGRFQAGNAACAALALGAWLSRSHHAVTPAMFEKALRDGLAATQWPGRLETIAHDPLVVIDVGHSPDAIEQAANGLFEAFGHENWLLVAGVSADKNATYMLAILKARFPFILCTQAHHKGRDAQEVAGLLRDLPGEAEIDVEPDIAAAAQRSVDIARERGLRIFVAGGLFAAVEFAQALRGKEPRALQFL